MSEKYESNEERVSYGIGRQMGEQLSANSFLGLNVEAVMEGLSDSLNELPCPVSDADMDAAFQAIAEQMKAEQTEGEKGQAEEGEQFLFLNSKREEVTVTPSGLQYEILTAGEGDIPSVSSTVRTHYKGTLINGNVFDSSYDRGEPAEFPLNAVIPGWTEALQIMSVGSKWRLYVPSELAYGERGAGAAIPPHAALVFDVELLDIVG